MSRVLLIDHGPPGSAVGLQFHPEVTPGLMRWWQGFDAAPWGVPGTQPCAEQDDLLARHDADIDA